MEEHAAQMTPPLQMNLPGFTDTRTSELPFLQMNPIYLYSRSTIDQS